MTVPVYNMTDTWTGGTAFTAIQMNVTNTSSAAGSYLIDLQIGGVSTFRADKVGTMSVGAGDGATAPDIFLFRDAAGIWAQRNSTNAQTHRVYNSFTDASNYERGVFDWTTTANTLTIGTQNLGSGNARQVQFVAPNTLQFLIAGTSRVVFGDSVPASEFLWFRTSGTGDLCFGSGTDIQFASTGAAALGDVGINRVAAKVISFTDGGGFTNAGGWYQWAGETRVTADVTFTSTTVLATVTGLSVNVAAGRTYRFEAQLSWTDAAAGGIQAAIAGSCTATNIVYDGWIVDSAANGIKGNAQATALATAVASATTTGTAGHLTIHGTITVNAAGTLLVQAAQNTTNATATTIKRGSTFLVFDMP